LISTLFPKGKLDDYFNFENMQWKDNIIDGVNLNELFDYDAASNTFKINTKANM